MARSEGACRGRRSVSDQRSVNDQRYGQLVATGRDVSSRTGVLGLSGIAAPNGRARRRRSHRHFRATGGGGRNRTGLDGFAIRCITSLPPRPGCVPRVWNDMAARIGAIRHKQKGKPRWLPLVKASRPASGAGNETRTRDLNLGKVALYQLSYSRTRHRGRIIAFGSVVSTCDGATQRDHVARSCRCPAPTPRPRLDRMLSPRQPSAGRPVIPRGDRAPSCLHEFSAPRIRSTTLAR